MIDLDLLNYFTESQNHRNFMITDVDLMLEGFDLPSLKPRAYLMYMVYGMASADWSTPGARAPSQYKDRLSQVWGFPR